MNRYGIGRIGRYSGVIVFSISLLSMIPSCSITTEGLQEAEVKPEDLFPPSKSVASYRQLKKPVKLAEGDLETQIGGSQKLGILKKWSPLSTFSAEYGIPDRPPVANVTVTELGTKQNAYGAYTNLRPGLLNESNYLKIGVHATVEGDRLIFVQDHFLVVVRSINDIADPARRTMLINFARAISDRIPRDITDVELVIDLPFEHRVPATERLDKEDPLGMGLFKAGGVTALYRIDNRECKVFLAQSHEGAGVKGLLQHVRDAMEKEGPTSDLGIGDEGFQGRLFKTQAMVGRRLDVIFGCYGTMTEKEMKNIMSGIDRRVKPFKPAPIKEKNEDREAKNVHQQTGN